MVSHTFEHVAPLSSICSFPFPYKSRQGGVPLLAPYCSYGDGVAVVALVKAMIAEEDN